MGQIFKLTDHTGQTTPWTTNSVLVWHGAANAAVVVTTAIDYLHPQYSHQLQLLQPTFLKRSH